MSIKVYRELTDEVRRRLFRRPRLNKTNASPDSRAVLHNVEQILSSIAEGGARSICDFRERFDAISGPLQPVSAEEVLAQAAQCSQDIQESILSAIKNVRSFHSSQMPQVKKIETVPGVTCWRRAIPIETVGLYVPGGSAPLFSSLIMLAVPALLCGCRRIVVCTPPTKEGSLHSSLAFVARELGIQEIFLIGGAQAVALMAYGSEDIEPVDKIFGPGNQYVTLAKQIVAGQGVAIDMPAGPSEVLVIADNTARADFIAADLLSQCEHGPDSQAILITDSFALIEEVQKELGFRMKSLLRAESLQASLANSFALCVDNLEQAISLSNSYAPEHLIIASKNAAELAENVINAGSVFIGNYAAEVFGDYVSGPNHTLPTAGYARAFSGVSCDSFCKFVTFQEVTAGGASSLAETVQTLALAEGLDAHALAARLRRGES